MSSKQELLREIEAQRALLVAVATGGPRIQEKNSDYLDRRQRIRDGLSRLEIKDPIPFGDLWQWYGRWSDGTLPTYQSRRQLLSEMFQPLIDRVLSTRTGLKSPPGTPPATSPRDRQSDVSPSSGNARVQVKNVPKVFISHSSRDARVAVALIEFLQAALPLNASEIRCTSIDGHRLKVGQGTNERLRIEVTYCPAFVALLTPDSLKSQYVMFEMGARWGAGLFFAPLLAKGVSRSELKEPLAGINWLDLCIPAQAQQLIEDLAQELQLTAEPPSAYQRLLEKLVEESIGGGPWEAPIVEILSAKWGIRGAEVDVTDAVRKLSEGDVVVVHAGNHLSAGEDPIHGTPKRLFVR